MPEIKKQEKVGLSPDLWFSTPIWNCQLSEYQRTNADVLTVLSLLEREGQSESLSRSNMGGWHSDTRLHQREDMAEITKAIAAACAECARSMQFDFVGFELLITEMWLNRNGPGDLNKLHIHPHSMLSGVYYVQVPPHSGNIEFLDPVLARTATSFPKTEKRQCNASTAEFEPVEGRLMIFPSWLQHWVQPNQGTGDRVSISFNVGFRPID